MTPTGTPRRGACDRKSSNRSHTQSKYCSTRNYRTSRCRRSGSVTVRTRQRTFQQRNWLRVREAADWVRKRDTWSTDCQRVDTVGVEQASIETIRALFKTLPAGAYTVLQDGAGDEADNVDYVVDWEFHAVPANPRACSI